MEIRFKNLENDLTLKDSLIFLIKFYIQNRLN